MESKLDKVLNEFFRQMYDKGVIDIPAYELRYKDKHKASILGYKAATITMYRHKDFVPYQKIVEIGVENDLDLNRIFK